MSRKGTCHIIMICASVAEDLHKLGESSGSLTASESDDNIEPDEDRVLQLIKVR